jgi:hypothetical protein
MAIKMEYLQKMEPKLAEAVEFSTSFFAKNLMKQEYMRVVPAYVYFMQCYYEFKYELRRLELLKQNKEKLDLTTINTISNNLNKAAAALNTAHQKMGEKSTIQYLKIKKGGLEQLPFYKLHKAKFRKWDAKTPRGKIIKSLEIWTGQQGESAVLQTISMLQEDASRMFDYILEIHDRKDLTNISINRNYMQMCAQLFRYYIKHRKKYIGTVIDKRKIKSAGDVVKLNIQDEFINVNIKFKTCDFNKFIVVVRNFVEALDKIDARAMGKLVFLTRASEVDDMDFRRLLKKDILDAVGEMDDDLKCVETPDINLETHKGASVETILKNVEKFILAEKKVEENLREIIDFNESHFENIKRLQILMNQLCGPDIRPCLLRIAPGVRLALEADENNFSGKKLSTAGEKKVREIICFNP